MGVKKAVTMSDGTFGPEAFSCPYSVSTEQFPFHRGRHESSPGRCQGLFPHPPFHGQSVEFNDGVGVATGSPVKTT